MTWQDVDEKNAERGVDQTSGFYRRRGKRAFDIVLALVLLPLTLPVIAVLSLIVARDGGKPIFRHRRIGLNGMPFGCAKLRSMVPDAEARLADLLASDPKAAAEWAEAQKLTDDPRVTPIGRILRKTSLDELPQILNVLRGEMSFVGPRPVVHDELSRYGSGAAAYVALRPGITGAWQASGRNDISYDERVALDVEYERDVTLLKDIHIVLMTVKAVLGGTGK